MQIKYSRQFVKQYEKSPIKIRASFKERIKNFAENQQNPQLNNHALSGKLKGYWSINVTGDWRAIYSWEDEETVIFEMLGTHNQLYR